MANVTDDGNLNNTEPEGFYPCINALNQVQRYGISSLNVFVAATAFLGNVLIIAALQKASSLHRTSKFLFCCLAVTDLCVGLISQPLYVAYLISPGNSVLCYYFEYVSPLIAITFCGVSLQTSTAISVDRLLALILGLRYRHTVTLQRVWAFVVISWLGSSGIAILYLYNDIISMYIVCVALMSCISTSTLCYVKIYRTLRHHQFQVQEHIPNEPPNRSRRGIPLNMGRYRKTVSSSLCVQITLVTCYLPFVIITIIANVTSLHYTPIIAVSSELATTLVQFNSCLNPVLYCWKIKEVRQEVKDIIRRFLCL